MQVGTWVQFENNYAYNGAPIGYITYKEPNGKYSIKVMNTQLKCNTLEFDVDGYATEYERKNKINRIIEFQA